MAKLKKSNRPSKQSKSSHSPPGYAMTLRKPAGNWMREKDKRMSQSVRRWKHG